LVLVDHWLRWRAQCGYSEKNPSANLHLPLP
jgi:hypothetical protein